MIHRPCCCVGVGPPSFPLSLTCVRERSADWRYFIVWHLVEGAACLARHAASRRSTVASSTLGPFFRVRTRERKPRADPGQLSPPLHPDRVQPLKAVPRSRDGREPRATRTSVRVHSGAGATPTPPLRRLMMAPSHEQAGGP